MAEAANVIASSPWKAEMTALRDILLACGLDETVKWGQACYVSGGANIVLIHGFKSYCALLFFKGALMADLEGLLVRQTGNVQSARQMRFTSLAEIEAARDRLPGYVGEAMRVETAGLKIEKKTAADMAWPEELRERLAATPELAQAFAALTPGRQRAYLLHFAGAKQAKTRAERVARHEARILAGKGLDD